MALQPVLKAEHLWHVGHLWNEEDDGTHAARELIYSLTADQHCLLQTGSCCIDLKLCPVKTCAALNNVW